jgi:hypothetical protein
MLILPGSSAAEYKWGLTQELYLFCMVNVVARSTRHEIYFRLFLIFFLPLSSVEILCPDTNLMSSHISPKTKTISFRLGRNRNAEPGVG